MFHLWFNTSYVENNYLRFTKAVTDKACKDLKCKHFSNDFEVELFFEPYNENDASGKSSFFSLFPFSFLFTLVSFSFLTHHFFLFFFVLCHFASCSSVLLSTIDIATRIDYETMVVDGSDGDQDTDEDEEEKKQQEQAQEFGDAQKVVDV